ncbi:hypothetical protein MHH81_08155 [Psychrobacillus sp. FSL H8-0484]|uniref:hypothetical protein n=1 Tax=Psychrobacillus sp. FSL H8-0484 TaxID=2921390 RepID=UPI0030F6A281
MWVMQSLPQKFFCDELCAGAGRGELRLPFPAEVVVFHYNQLPTKNGSLIKSIQKTGVEKDSFFYTCFNLWAYWTALTPFSVILWLLSFCRLPATLGNRLVLF